MQRSVTTVGADESLGLAFQLMRWNDIRHLPVLRPADGRLVGVVSERDIFRVQQEQDIGPAAMARPVRDFMSSPAEHVHPEAAVSDAAALLSARKIGCLPVVRAGELVGIITVSDALATVAYDPPERKLSVLRGVEGTAASIMRPDPIAVRPDDHLASVIEKMAAGGVRHLAVTDVDDGVVGIVSERDLRAAVGDLARAADEPDIRDRVNNLRVQDVMTPEPRVLRLEDPMAVVIDAFVRDRFGALPVVDAGDRVVGIVSYIDVLKYFGQRVG